MRNNQLWREIAFSSFWIQYFAIVLILSTPVSKTGRVGFGSFKLPDWRWNATDLIIYHDKETRTGANAAATLLAPMMGVVIPWQGDWGFGINWGFLFFNCSSHITGNLNVQGTMFRHYVFAQNHISFPSSLCNPAPHYISTAYIVKYRLYILLAHKEG